MANQKTHPCRPPDSRLWHRVGGWGVGLVCVVLAATAFLPLLNVNWWWIRIGDFPRLQLLFGYLVALALLVPFYRRRVAWVGMATMAAAAMIQLVWIFPYLPVAPWEVESANDDRPGSRLRIMTANVLQENEQYEKLLEVVDDVQPDILVLVEVNQRWIDRLASLEKEFPYSLEHPLENRYGIAFYARPEVTTAEVRFLVKDDIPSIDATIRLPSGRDVRLFAVHPNPPRPGEDTTKRDAELVLVGRELARSDSTAVVLGDLNDVGWSATTNLFQEVSGLLDPRKGRGIYPTFNAHSWIWRYPLDHLFHSDDFRLVKLETLAYIGSDHFPLLVELSHEPSAEATQNSPDLDAGDREQAQEAVEEAEETPSTDVKDGQPDG